MTTARDIVTLAFKEAGILGVGQTLLAQDVNDGFTYLYNMAMLWQRKRWLIPALMRVNALGNNAVSNTIGTGGYYNIKRPDKIQSGYFVQVNTGPTPVSMPLRQIFSYEDYVKIAIKDLNTFPTHFFYDNAWTAGFGNVFIYPIPSASYRIYLLIKSQLGFPTDLDSVFELPEEYLEALHYNLAIRLCSGYDIEPKESTKKLAKNALQTVRNANVQIPTMNMPTAVIGNNRGFNIYNPDGY